MTARVQQKALQQRGFSLLEQLIALALIIIGSLCAMEAIAFCLLAMRVSEDEWQKGLDQWNQAQIELMEEKDADENDGFSGE